MRVVCDQNGSDTIKFMCYLQTSSVNTPGSVRRAHLVSMNPLAEHGPDPGGLCVS